MNPSRKFLLSRELTDTELANLYRFVDSNDVDFYRALEFSGSPHFRVYAKFHYWYNLPFTHQTLLEMLLPCQSRVDVNS
jgi:hypothetical protein